MAACNDRHENSLHTFTSVAGHLTHYFTGNEVTRKSFGSIRNPKIRNPKSGTASYNNSIDSILSVSTNTMGWINTNYSGPHFKKDLTTNGRRNSMFKDRRYNYDLS